MAELTPRAITRYESPSSTKLLARVLEEPGLVEAVRGLPAQALGRLIDGIGLEGAGELVALATTEQLGQVFDQDLWSAQQAAGDEHFDPARFATWLDVMLEAGEAAVAQRLCELPLDLVTLGVQGLLLVIDIESLAIQMSNTRDDTDLLEKALDSCLSEEWEEYRLLARDARAWDTVLSCLLALDRDHHQRLRSILEHCAAMSSEYIEDNGGLYEVLSAEEMLEADAAAQREERRGARGYVSPADARSFLALAERRLSYAEGRDPVTRAYFRELDRSATAEPQRTTGAPPTPETNRLMNLVAKVAGQAPNTTRPALNGPATRRAIQRSGARFIDVALVGLGRQQPSDHTERIEELSYLTNVLLAGYAENGRRLRPVEATEKVLDVCNRGLVDVMSAVRRTQAESEIALEVVRRVPADRLFRIAWGKAALEHRRSAL